MIIYVVSKEMSKISWVPEFELLIKAMLPGGAIFRGITGSE